MRTLRGLVLPVLMIAIGVGLIVQTLTVLGVILGVLFIGAGAGRIYVERKLS